MAHYEPPHLNLHCLKFQLFFFFLALSANTVPFVADFSSTPSAFSTPSSASSANAGEARPSVIGWTDTRHRGDGRDGDTSGSSSRYIYSQFCP